MRPSDGPVRQGRVPVRVRDATGSAGRWAAPGGGAVRHGSGLLGYGDSGYRVGMFTTETATAASARGHASMTPDRRRERARLAHTASVISQAVRLITEQPELFTDEQLEAIRKATQK